MPIHPADEGRLAAEMARELEGIGTAGGVHVSDDFADRVMARVALTPLPTRRLSGSCATRGTRVRRAHR